MTPSTWNLIFLAIGIVLTALMIVAFIEEFRGRRLHERLDDARQELDSQAQRFDRKTQLLSSAKATLKEELNETKAALETIKASISKHDPRDTVCVRYEEVIDDELKFENRVTFKLSVTNWSDADITGLDRLSGQMAYGQSVYDQQNMQEGPKLQLSDDGVIKKGRGSFMRLSQQLPEGIAKSITEGIDVGERQTFDWRDLKIPFSYKDKDYELLLAEYVHLPSEDGGIQIDINNLSGNSSSRLNGTGFGSST